MWERGSPVVKGTLSRVSTHSRPGPSLGFPDLLLSTRGVCNPGDNYREGGEGERIQRLKDETKSDGKKGKS